MVIVTKFGGTSAKDGPTLEHVIRNIVLENKERRVLNFSAPAGITNRLIAIGEHYLDTGEYQESHVEEVKDRFVAIANHFGISENVLTGYFTKLEESIKRSDPNREMYLDQIRPFGEIVNSNLVARALQLMGVDAVNLTQKELGMYGNGSYGSAHLNVDSYTQMSGILNENISVPERIIVIAGYYLINQDNEHLMTVGRGGSDTTAAYAARAVKASLYENWTDVDGIMTADPRHVTGTKSVRSLSYRKAREASYLGAKILHSDTLIPLIDYGIPVRVRNTKNIGFEGTYIGPENDTAGNTIDLITHKSGFKVVYLSKIGINDMRGYLADVTRIFSDNGVSIEHDTTGVDGVAIAVESGINLEDVIRDLREKSLVDGDGIMTDDNRSFICLVGNNINTNSLVYGKVGLTFASHNISMQPFSGSRTSIPIAIPASFELDALKYLHNEFFGA